MGKLLRNDVVRNKGLTFLTKPSQTFVGVSNEGNWCFKTFVWSKFPGKVLILNSDSYTHLIDLTLLDKCLEITAIHELEAQGFACPLARFVITKN